jgi:RimJ/RimL family protein N-acetyltransferase
VKPTLCGDLVELRPFTGADVDTMAEILADPEIARLTGSVTSTEDLGQPPPLESLREWYGSRSDQDDRLDLAVVDRATGRVVGEVVLNEWEPDCASANFRILVGSAGRGRGLGTEATRLLLAHAFETVGLHRVSLEVFDFTRALGASTKRSASCTKEPGGRRTCSTASASTPTTWRCSRRSGVSTAVVRAAADVRAGGRRPQMPSASRA